MGILQWIDDNSTRGAALEFFAYGKRYNKLSGSQSRLAAIVQRADVTGRAQEAPDRVSA
jgi:hypothetical protein